MTDAQRRYKLFKFLNYYVRYGFGSGASVLGSGYASRNFWIDFCRDSSLSLTDLKVSKFMTDFLIALEKTNEKGLTSISRALSDSDVLPYFTTAFNNIGVAFTTASSLLTFTMPNSSTKTMNCVTLNPCLNVNLRQEIRYAEKAYPITSFENIPLEDIYNLNFDCGTDSYLSLANNIFTINGSGASCGLQATRTNTAPFSTSASATTLIINKNITRLYSAATYRSDQINNQTSYTVTTIVFEHSNTDLITLDSGWIASGKASSSTKPTFNIYTDNDTVKNYNYGTNITVNIHPLSEWSG